MGGESSQLSAGTGILDMCRKFTTGCTGAVGHVCSSAGRSVLVKHLKPMPFHFACSAVSSLIRA